MNYRILKRLGCLFAILILFCVVGCSDQSGEAEIKTEKIVSVNGQEVFLTSKELKRTFTGTLEGEKQAAITAKISEAVEEVTVREGDNVKAGDVLIRLDRTGPTSNHVQRYSVYRNAEKNYEKTKYLFEEGAVSESQFDAAKTEYEVSKANYDAARKLVDIRTPIAGTVTSISISPGDYLHPGQEVATVAFIDKLRMKFGVSGADIGFFSVGDEVEVSVESTSGQSSIGKVSTVASSADPVTRTFQVEIEIDNQAHILKPGMFARAKITVEIFDNIIVIPRNAVVDRDSKDYLFVISDGRAVARRVILGVEFDGTIEIRQGLNPGDTLITVGQNYLDDGYNVKLVQFLNAKGEEIEL